MRPRTRPAVAVPAAALFALLLVGGALGSALVIYSSLPQAQPPQQLAPGVTLQDGRVTVQMHVSLALNVTVMASPTNHTVVASRYEPHDLITNNFFNYFKAFFLNQPSGTGTGQVTLADTSNVGRAGCMWGCNNYAFISTSTITAAWGGYIEVGTSSTTPLRPDYQLNVPYQSFFSAITSACTVGASSSSFTASGSENAQSGATLQEAGLFLSAYSTAGGYQFMLAHDTFAGVAVTSANVITITYTWTLNSAGINRNFCYYLASLMDNTNFGTSTGFNQASSSIRAPLPQNVFYSTIGANVTWAVVCSPGSQYVNGLSPLSNPSPSAGAGCQGFASQAASENAIYVAVGTGATPFTPSTNALTTFNHQSVTTLTTYDGAGNLFVTASNVLGSSATITEASIYITLPGGCEGYAPHASSNAGSCTGGFVTLTTMWFAATFTGVAVSGSNPIGVYFELSG